jgi:NAD(P)-dependent dehydrogenase (short-subunit alcohol dehydrogenase family)
VDKQGIAMPCDHTDDALVQAISERIRSEQGRLDVLVANAWGGYMPYPEHNSWWSPTSVGRWRHSRVTRR